MKLKFINFLFVLFALIIPHHLCGAKKQTPKETKQATFINDTKEEKETKDEFGCTKMIPLLISKWKLFAEVSPVYAEFNLYQSLDLGDTGTIRDMLNDPLVYKYIQIPMFTETLEFAIENDNKEVFKSVLDNEKWQAFIVARNPASRLEIILNILVETDPYLNDLFNVFFTHDFCVKYLSVKSIKKAIEIVREDASRKKIFTHLTLALLTIQYQS